MIDVMKTALKMKMSVLSLKFTCKQGKLNADWLVGLR